MERDCDDCLKRSGISISTHTLTWSVTKGGKLEFDDSFISTHTLTWSVTEITPVTKRQAQISTHTLTWSVTELVRKTLVRGEFQLTRSRGA